MFSSCSCLKNMLGFSLRNARKFLFLCLEFKILAVIKQLSIVF